MDERLRNPSESSRHSRARRLYLALGPLAGGLLLDSLDLVTFGPLGYGGGFLVGGILGAWVGSMEGFGWMGRLYLAVLAMFYTALPRTELLPLATLIAMLGRYFREPYAPSEGEPADPRAPEPRLLERPPTDGTDER